MFAFSNYCFEAMPIITWGRALLNSDRIWHELGVVHYCCMVSYTTPQQTLAIGEGGGGTEIINLLVPDTAR